MSHLLIYVFVLVVIIRSPQIRFPPWLLAAIPGPFTYNRTLPKISNITEDAKDSLVVPGLLDPTHY
jgi:ABC-type polysaccharide/polyol phosphate export permease